MTEQELRALVREAIARAGAAAVRPEDRQPRTPAPAHSSHALFTLAPGDPDGRCLIEPGVACNHCGYCKSYGH
jgi:hypothetical protein